MNSSANNKFYTKKGRFGRDGHRAGVPEPDVLGMLRPDGSNLTKWLRALHRRLQQDYGELGQFVETKQLFVRELPTLNELKNMYSGLTNDQCKELLASCAKDHIKLVMSDKSNYVSMFGLIFNHMSDEGSEMVREHSAWTDCNNEKDPLKLINIVRNVHSLRMNNINTAEAQYLAAQRYQNIRMLPGVSLAEYRIAFDQAVENMKELKHQHIPTDAMQALHFIVRLDPARYNEFTTAALNSPRAGGGFPDTVQKACDAAKSYMPLVRVSNQRASNPMVFSTKLNKKAAKFNGTCNHCHKHGHKEADCWDKKRSDGDAQMSDDTQQQQSKKEESSVDHKGPKQNGNNASKKKKNNAANKRAAYTSSVNTGTSDYSADIFGYTAGLEIGACATNVRDMRNKRLVSIDCCANYSFAFCTEIMTDLQHINFTVEGVSGIGNGSTIGNLPCFGEIAHTPQSGKNGLALWQAESRYVVDRAQMEHFTVHITDDYSLRFDYDDDTKLYTCEFTDEVMNKLIEIEADINSRRSMYTLTVSENESRYSKREVTNAKLARRMMKILYYPSDSLLVRTINNGIIINSPVTGKDVVLATAIYGKAPESIAGKAKDYGPVADTNLYVPLDDRREQTVYADIFYWHSMTFLYFVVKPLHMVMTKHVEFKDVESLQGPVQQMINLIVAQGFSVSKIWTDPERGFVALNGRVSAPIQSVGARQHVADAEVEIRILKERLRSTESGLAYNVCNKLAIYMVYGATMALNCMPRTDRDVSPREKFLGVKLNYNNDLRIPFGEYVHAEVMPNVSEKNTNVKRAVAAIALIPQLDGRGTYLFYDINTGSEFRAHRWTELPMPDLIIEKLNQVFDKDNPNKVGRNKRNKKKAVGNDQPAQQLADDVNDANNTTENNLVRLPTLRGDPEHQMVPDIIAAHTGVPSEEEYIEPTIPGSPESMHDNNNSNDDVVEDDVINDVQESEYGVEDPSSHLESLGHTTIDGVRKSIRLSKKQIDQRVLNVYKLTVAIALKRNERLSKAAILAELRQMIDKDVWNYIAKSSLTVQ